MNTKRFLVFLIVISMALLTACGGDDAAAAPDAPTSTPLPTEIPTTADADVTDADVAPPHPMKKEVEMNTAPKI